MISKLQKSIILINISTFLLTSSSSTSTIPDKKPFYISIAEKLFNEKKAYKFKKDDLWDFFVLNNSKHDSFCYYVICSLYDRMLEYYKDIKDENQEKFFAELNKEENYTLLYDFLNSVLINKKINRNFKTDSIEIREGYEQNYKYYSIRIGNLSTRQFVFNFAPESLLTPYEIWKEVYEKEAFDNFKNQEENKQDEKGAFFIYIRGVYVDIYHSITMDSYSPGIFYDSHFLEGKAYTPHE